MWRSLAQKLSGVLIVPIVIIPVAAVFLAAGFLLGENQVLIAAGRAIIPHFLPLFFALGVIIGFAGGDGWAALSAAVGYGVMVAVATAVSGSAAPLNLAAPGGLAIGGVVAYLYNRFHRVELPEFLGLFSGKRLIPTLAALAGLPMGLLAGWTWPAVLAAVDAIGHWAYTAGPAGAFVYGALDRALVPLGMHHVLNNLVEHQLGTYIDPGSGKQLLGEIARFFAGDPAAGKLMSGFFIFNNFSVPAMALAIARTARPEQRRRVGGLMSTAGLTSVVTGITEPVEFAFVFASPFLWGVNIFFGGLASYLAYALEIRHWGYAAPMFFINLGHSTNAWWIPVLGVGFFAVQFAIFYFYIRAARPAILGQEAGAGPLDAGAEAAPAHRLPVNDFSQAVLRALGGAGNLASAGACATRLRLMVRDEAQVNDGALRALGAHGVVRLGGGAVQVVLGSRAEAVAAELRAFLHSQGGAPRPDAAAALQAPAPGGGGRAGDEPAMVELLSPLTGTVVPLPEVPDPVFSRRLAGDGVAVDPGEGQLVAPCNARVVHVFPGGHAVGLEGPGGLEILLHVGIDTSGLMGAGFTVQVREGDPVRAGEPLVRFDPETVRESGRSLVTPVLITNLDGVERLDLLTRGEVLAGKTPLLRVVLRSR